MSTYMLGTLSCAFEQVEDVVDAINYLRDAGTRIACSRAKAAEGDGYVVPLMYKGMTEAADQLASVLDIGKIRWTSFSPQASNPKSISMARLVDASVGSKEPISSSSVLPSDKADAFEGLVGLAKQRRLIKHVADAIAAYGENALECKNMCFVGAPGTGKTELASRFAQYCGQQGITRTGRLVQVSAAEMISNHVGETPKFVRQAFDRADGGVLFLDEAYSIALGDGNDFGQEAISAITEAMDRLRDRVVVIAAGYESEMNDFLRSNPGLESRFEFTVRFDGYSDEELAMIYGQFGNVKQFSIESEVLERLPARMGRLRGTRGFAAARTVRKLFDLSVITAAQKHPDKREIYLSDVDEGIETLIQDSGKDRIVGFI